MRKVREFDFEGIIIKVPSEYDENSGKYILDVPDFEETPIYTPSGKPLVAAVQDRCNHAPPAGNYSDCGSCEFYKPNAPGDLIGICHNPKMGKS